MYIFKATSAPPRAGTIGIKGLIWVAIEWMVLTQPLYQYF